MEGQLLVTPEDLIRSASEFSTDGSNVKSITQEMMSIVTSLTSSYEGDAATAFLTKFKALEEDMNQIDAKIQEHVTDLNEMAQNYQNTENTLTEQNSALQSDYIS